MLRCRVATVALLVAGLSACTGDDAPDAQQQPPPPPPSQSATAPAGNPLRLTQPRAVHQATTLADGRVLFTGGCTEPGCGGFDAARRAEVYDAASGFARDAEMLTARAGGTATLLRDGRVLLTGGYPGEGIPPTAAAEIYDPVGSTFTPVADLLTARAAHTATPLPDGRVVLAGGIGADGDALDGTEFFDPDTDTFVAGPRLSAPRAAHVAVRVDDAVVLIGGTERTGALGSTDVLDGGRWQPGPDLRTPRVKTGAVALADGRVLVVGGSPDTEGREKLASTELIDLVAGESRPGPSMTEGEYKLENAIITLPDGRVVVASADALEIYDPAVGVFDQVSIGTETGRSFRTVTAVGPSTVLVAGGYDEQIVPSDAALLVTLPLPGSSAASTG